MILSNDFLIEKNPKLKGRQIKCKHLKITKNICTVNIDISFIIHTPS